MRARLLIVCLASLFLIGATKPERCSSLLTVEGEVLTIGHEPGEGSVDLLTVTLTGSEGVDAVVLLLAPENALDQLDFEISVGDRLRAKVFPTTEGLTTVHKVTNLSNNFQLRLRTLHRIPLWGGDGVWQGGPGQGGMGGPTCQQRRRQRAPDPGL